MEKSWKDKFVTDPSSLPHFATWLIEPSKLDDPGVVAFMELIAVEVDQKRSPVPGGVLTKFRGSRTALEHLAKSEFSTGNPLLDAWRITQILPEDHPEMLFELMKHVGYEAARSGLRLSMDGVPLELKIIMVGLEGLDVVKGSSN